MRRFSLPIVLLPAAIAVGALAVAQDAPVGDAGGNVHYAWANVTRVNPIYRTVQVPAPPAHCDTAPAPAGSARGAADAPVKAAPCPPLKGTTERRIVGYTVEYRYRGYVYTSRLDYDPGTRLRVRITVTPAD